MVVFTALNAFGATQNCENEYYRRTHPEKCKSGILSNKTLLTLTGGAILVGTGVALAAQSSSGNGTSSNSNQTSFQRTTLSPNIAINYALSDYVKNKKINAIYLDSLTHGTDIDTSVINSIKSDIEYQRNYNQYNSINFAYAIARGHTGTDTNINVLDNFYIMHGNAVRDVLHNIAPGANITTNNIGISEDSFGSFDYIANKINNSFPARVYNASWQIPVSTNASAASAIYNSNGSVKTYHQAQSYLYNLTSENFINQIRNSAVDNDAIFVWAAGNDSAHESGALSALPLAFPDLSGHFINVVALDNYGEIAWYSNQCGITQNYCISAPGSGWDTDTQLNATGTSFATPVVSGAIAIIKETFPYMSATQISQLLFTTATDLGEPGIDSVYGWGLLDMEKATKPVGTPRIILSDTNIIPLGTTYITGSAAPAIQKANVKIAFFDDFDRAFTTNLSDNMKVIPYGRGFDKLRESGNESIVLFDSLEFGFSQNHLLESGGLFSIQSNQLTNFVGYKNEFKFNELQFYQNARIGITHPTTSEESIISGFSNIYTSSIKIGTKWHDLSFEVAIPETIISGNMYVTVPTGRSNDGHVIYNRANIDLSNANPSIEYTIAYKYLSATFVNNQDYENEFFIMAKRKFAF